MKNFNNSFFIIQFVLLNLLVLSSGIFGQSSAGMALNFDGANDVAYPLNPNAAGLAEGTIEFWFSTDNWSTSRQLWGGGNGLPGANGDWVRIGTHSSAGGSGFAFGQYAGGWQWLNSNMQPDTATWYHVAVTWGPGGRKLYYNGKLEVQNSSTGAIHNYNTELMGASSWGFEFKGNIDEIRIWNFAKDSLSIASTLFDTLNTEYYSSTDSGLIAYYRMDMLEDLGINSDGADDLRDLSVNSNHLDTQGNPVLETSGAFGFVTGIENQLPDLPETIELFPNYPNPFNPSTTLSFVLSKVYKVEINIYNVLGEKMKTLYNSTMEAGYNTLQWNGTNDYNNEVPSGLYFFTLRATDGSKEIFAKSSKLLLIK